LFTSDEFAASTERRIRRPLELYAAMVRAIARPGYDRTKLAASRWALVSATSYLAGTPHHWPDPNGYPDLDQAWVSAGSMISRWNMATWVLTNLPEAFDLDWSFIRSWASAPTVGAWCDAAERRLDIVLPTAQRNQMLTELYRTASSPLAASGTDWVIRRVLNQYLQHPRMNLR
jgi:hypothetical protein